MARIKHYQKYTHSVLNIYDWGGFFADFRIVKVFYLVSFASKTPITGWTIVDCSIEVRTVSEYLWDAYSHGFVKIS